MAVFIKRESEKIVAPLRSENEAKRERLLTHRGLLAYKLAPSKDFLASGRRGICV
jgi:hypothetical protein